MKRTLQLGGFSLISTLVMNCAGVQTATAVTTGAEQTPEQRLHCEAVGMVFRQRSDEMLEKIKGFDAVFTDPDESQKVIRDDLVKTQTAIDQIATALEPDGADSAFPTDEQVAALATRSLQDLMPDVQTCLQ